MRTNETKNEIDEIKKWEEQVERKDLKRKINKYLYDFQQFEIIISFGDTIYYNKINIYEAVMDQSNPLENMAKFNNRSKPNTKEGKNKKQNIFDNALYEGRKSTLKAFESGIFPIEATKGEGLNL